MVLDYINNCCSNSFNLLNINCLFQNTSSLCNQLYNIFFIYLGKNELNIHMDDSEKHNLKLFLQYENLYDMPNIIVEKFAPYVDYLDICFNKLT